MQFVGSIFDIILYPEIGQAPAIYHYVIVSVNNKYQQITDSVVQCDQLKSLDKSRIKKKRGHFPDNIMERVDTALEYSLALH